MKVIKRIVKVYIKSFIQGKNISKSINFKNNNLEENKNYEKIIIEIKKELINLVKSENLIDIRTPSFLNAKLDLNKKSNLVELNLRIKNIDLIENVYVQDFNKDFMNLRIKYLGKLEKIINQLNKEKVNLQLVNDQWIIKHYKWTSLYLNFLCKKILQQDFFVSSNNFSAYKLIESWPTWPGKWLNILGHLDLVRHIYQKY